MSRENSPVVTKQGNIGKAKDISKAVTKLKGHSNVLLKKTLKGKASSQPEAAKNKLAKGKSKSPIIARKTITRSPKVNKILKQAIKFPAVLVVAIAIGVLIGLVRRRRKSR